jgi:hypothetical protein
MNKRFGGALQCGEPIFVIDMSKKFGKDAYRVFPYNLEAAEVYSEVMDRLSGDFEDEEIKCGAV